MLLRDREDVLLGDITRVIAPQRKVRDEARRTMGNITILIDGRFQGEPNAILDEQRLAFDIDDLEEMYDRI